MSRASPMLGHTTRWSLFGMMFALLLVASAVNGQETEEMKCSDTTTDNRPCTPTEEVEFCIKNAVAAFEDCKRDANLVEKIACAGLYYIDFWLCGLELPIEVVKK